MPKTEAGANLKVGGQSEVVEGRELGAGQCCDELEAECGAVETADSGARECGLQNPFPAVLRRGEAREGGEGGRGRVDVGGARRRGARGVCV